MVHFISKAKREKTKGKRQGKKITTLYIGKFRKNLIGGSPPCGLVIGIKFRTKTKKDY